jgi:catechol 2,3-dioxygenase-like lactoylglutathione lyase family enzyme
MLPPGAGEGGVPPPIAGVLETALYCDDLTRASRFYEDVIGLKRIFADERLAAYEAGPRSVLLLFRRGSTLETITMPGGTIPPHDGQGPLHIAFAIPAEALHRWERHLAERGIAVEGRTEWPKGGTSIYFRDPDGHLVELATPGLWPNY